MEMNYKSLACVYLLTNTINNKIYVGKTIDLKVRLVQHRSREGKRYKSIIKRAIEKYGWENFSISILEVVEDKNNERLLELEREWILKLGSSNKKIGYNICLYSNDRTGIPISEEQKLKLSKIMKEKWASGENNPWKGQRGETHPLYGKSPSKETRDKISKTLTGREGKKGVKLPLWQVALLITRNSKPVYQINPQNNTVIKKWESAAEASRQLNIPKPTISVSCRVDGRLAGGYKWEFVPPIPPEAEITPKKE
jgi:group I intron endonuclease